MTSQRPRVSVPRLEVWLLAALVPFVSSGLMAQASGVQAEPAAEVADEAAAASTEPVLKPGIPGLKMIDVRELKHLWRELDELQVWEVGGRITVAEYRSKAIEKTAIYLGFETAKAESFTALAQRSVASLREAFRRSRQPEVDLVAANAQYLADVEVTVSELTASLDATPRHKLFAPDVKKWLYRLTFGPKSSKEAKEAKEATASAAPPPQH